MKPLLISAGAGAIATLSVATLPRRWTRATTKLVQETAAIRRGRASQRPSEEIHLARSEEPAW
jgi:hypothetical protein